MPTSQHTPPKPTLTGWGALLAMLGLGFGLGAIATTAAFHAGWFPAQGRSAAPQAAVSVRPAAVTSSPVAGSRPAVAQAHSARGAISGSTLRAMIAGSHRWSVSIAPDGGTPASPISCTTDDSQFSCSDYCGTNAGKIQISADDSKLTQTFVLFCNRPSHKVLDYDVQSFKPTRFRLQGPKDSQEWVLDD